MSFKSVNPKQSLPALERKTLGFWRSRNIFQKSIDNREAGRPGAKGDYVFFDGPPGTNGVPHIGHMMQSALKDVWPRFKTMQGYRVLRKAGWDTHGLPVELQAEKELGLESKRDIHNYGMKKYVSYCRNTVFRYLKEWEKAITRIGRFLDMSDAYATLSNDYIQTDWWVISQAHKKGLLYKDFKILPYCSRCGTGLSSHEVAQGYKEVTDTSVYVKFKVKGEKNTYLLVWTTTPWTLIANVAVAVGPKIKYVVVNTEFGERLVMAESRVAEVMGEINYDIAEPYTGEQLAQKEYEPVYDFFKPDKKAFYVVAEDFVTAEDGTGLVHLAAYGEDDYRIIKKYKLPLIQHLDLEGRLKPEVGRWQGLSFKEVDKEVVEDLKKRELLFKAEPHKHSYPFCWRCDTPLIYNAQSSWFIKTTALRQQMIAANKKINWQPNNIKEGRFGKWLESNVDWAVSRSRFWGSPLPVWTCGKCEEIKVIANVEELRAAALTEIPANKDLDLHKPWIDTVKLKCDKCAGEMEREPDVLDCWFNAGNMPWGQWGYPHKKGSAEIFKTQYPADFICEAIDQTRGWFYVLLAVSTMLTGESSYKNVICTDLILDEKGHKMSKSLGNVVEPVSLFEKFGADNVRWTFFRNDPWLPRKFGENIIEESSRAFFRPLWNVYSFFVTYANLDKFVPPSIDQSKSGRESSGADVERPYVKHILDRWILSELTMLIGEVTDFLEKYDISPATNALERFIDDLSNWYVRRSRRRFWKSENDQDKNEAEQTLYYVLVKLSQVLAPLTPFVAEEIYRNLTGGGLYRDERGSESVHLSDWPKSMGEVDEKLVEQMRLARKVSSLARAARQEADIRVRQPLQSLEIATKRAGSLPRAVEQLIIEEANVKQIEYVDDPEKLGKPKIKINFAVAGKKYGAEVKEMQKLILRGDFSLEAGRVRVKGRTLDEEDVIIDYQAKKGLAVAGEKDLLVGLDIKPGAELVREGLAREIIRAVQELRKKADLAVSDRILLAVVTEDASLAAAVADFKQEIMGETLAQKIVTGEPTKPDGAAKFVFEKHEARLAVKKIQ